MKRSLISILALGGCCSLIFIALILASNGGGGAASQDASASRPTPGPTPTPENAPHITEMRSEMRGMTDAQLDAYIEGVLGLRVDNWQGTVKDVEEFAGDYTAVIAIDGNPDNEVAIPVDIGTGLALNKGDRVSVSGQIGQVLVLFGVINLTLDNGAEVGIE